MSSTATRFTSSRIAARPRYACKVSPRPRLNSQAEERRRNSCRNTQKASRCAACLMALNFRRTPSGSVTWPHGTLLPRSSGQGWLEIARRFPVAGTGRLRGRRLRSYSCLAIARVTGLDQRANLHLFLHGRTRPVLHKVNHDDHGIPDTQVVSSGTPHSERRVSSCNRTFSISIIGDESGRQRAGADERHALWAAHAKIECAADPGVMALGLGTSLS